MTKADELVDRGADRLQELADRAAASGGVKAKLADELANDAAFLRKLKPSLIAARARGRAPTDERPTSGHVSPKPSAKESGQKDKGSGGPNPILIILAALTLGIVLAKLIDWRGHAHPRD